MSVQAILYSKGSEVVTISPDAPVKSAADKLAERNIAGLVVVDGSAILGVVSERDIVLAYSRHGPDLTGIAVRDILTTGLVTVSPNDSLKRAMTLFTRHRVRHLPVLQNGKLAGLISIGDVIKRRLDDLEPEAKGHRDGSFRSASVARFQGTNRARARDGRRDFQEFQYRYESALNGPSGPTPI
jgi:CBS domain-containing protein